MIFGECPYDDCDEYLMIPIADHCPVFQKINCPKCGRIIWEYHSRIEPEAFTEKEFNEKYEIEEETKTIKKRLTTC
jgi:hypothetical protein